MKRHGGGKRLRTMARQNHRLAQVPLFNRMGDAALARLAASSRVREYPAGQVLWHEGDPGDALLILEAGRLRISRVRDNASESVLAIVEPVAAIGELALLDGAPRDATVVAQRDVTVRLIPRQVFLNLLRNEPGVADQLILNLADMVRAANERHERAVGLDVPGRLVGWLRQRARVSGQLQPNGDIRVVIDRSQAELAAELWTTRSTLNRALRDLESRGLIRVDDDAILLLDPDQTEERPA
jgi:CRP-like cAMP-binding protein